MDPRIQEAAAIIQKMMEVIAMMAEEIQNLKGATSNKKQDESGIQKQASFSEMSTIAAELSVSTIELPEFLKYASIEQFNTLRERIVALSTGDDFTKVAFIGGSNDEDFDLNAALTNIANS